MPNITNCPRCSNVYEASSSEEANRSDRMCNECWNSRTFRIVRFRQEGLPREVIKEGCDLEEARSHCGDPATQGIGWFDGYEEE